MTAHVKPITVAAFDALLQPASKRKDQLLWGRPAISRVLGVCDDTVAAWAKLPDVPIFEPLPGRYLAYRSELERWMRTKQTGEIR